MNYCYFFLLIADDMGLGKTLTMIALILKQRENEPRPKSRDLPSGEEELLSVKATLVVVPLTLLDMWNNEIRSKVDPHTLSILIYHGPKRTKDHREYAKKGCGLLMCSTCGRVWFLDVAVMRCYYS